MIRRPPRSTQSRSSAASDVYKRQPYYNATIHMAERFSNFYIDHVPRRQNAHADALASLAASLALPAGVMEKVFVYSHDLYCPKIPLGDYPGQREIVAVKKHLKCQPLQSLKTGDSPILILSYTAFCPKTPRRRPPFGGKPPNSTIMRFHEHCIVDRMTGSLSLIHI